MNLKKTSELICPQLIELQLLFFPLCILFLTAIGFFINLSISRYHFVFALFFSMFLVWVSNKQFIRTTNKKLLFAYLASGFFFLIAFSFSSFFIDSSWDGLAYHQPTIIALAHGWNPFYQPDISPLTTKLFNLGSGLRIETNHWGMASELIAAVIFKATGSLEASKCYNLMYLLILALLGFRFLKKFESTLTRCQVYLILIPLVLNPVALYQLQFFYVDGQLASLISILLILLLDYLIFNESLSLIEAALVFVILFNVKFTGAVFASFFVSAFFILAISFKSKQNFRSYFLIFFTGFLIAYCLIGYQPYLSNTLAHYNPFYSVLNPNIKFNLYPGINPDFAHENRFLQFISSLFANKYLNIQNHNLRFVVFPQSYDARFAGFGLIFGYLFFISLIFIFCTKNKYFLSASLILLVSIFILSGAWWARLVPQTWLIPIMISMALLISQVPKWYKTVATAILIVMVINAVGILLLSFIYQTGKTLAVRNSLTKLSQKTTAVQISYQDSNLSEIYLLNKFNIEVSLKPQVACASSIVIPNFLTKNICHEDEIVLSRTKTSSSIHQ